MRISIKGLEKAAVLRALFNASGQHGMGLMDPRGARGMADTDAQEIIDCLLAAKYPLSFDYLRGRVLKVDISVDEFEAALYDRDNGDGAAARAIAEIRAAP